MALDDTVLWRQQWSVTWT